MPDKLEAADKFATSLGEVELLLCEAEKAAPDSPEANEQRFAVMNKSALLLLSGKFEAFLEEAVEDFLFAINGVGATARHLPLRILAEHSVEAVKEAKKQLDNGDVETIRSMFVALGRYWINMDPCAELAVPCKFNYGKHGEKEIVKLFRRIGIDDVFGKVEVPDDSVESYDDGKASLVDIKGIVNSLTGMRNNILHQDQSPSLTSTSLRKQCDALRRFASAVVAELQGVLNRIETDARSEHP